MKLADAQSIIREVEGKQYTWLKAWGISTIKEAISTIKDRLLATIEDKEIAEGIEIKLDRKW